MNGTVRIMCIDSELSDGKLSSHSIYTAREGTRKGTRSGDPSEFWFVEYSPGKWRYFLKQRFIVIENGLDELDSMPLG